MDSRNPPDTKMNTSGAPRGRLLPFSIYILVNTLFVWKYSSEYADYPWMPVVYLLVIIAFLRLSFKDHRSGRLPTQKTDRIYFTVVTLSAFILALLMFQFDPDSIAVGRYPALHDWISRLLAGKFPYASAFNPSGMPFLFILAMPFYFLGDPGLLQIFSFMVFGGVVYLQSGRNLVPSLRILVLLIVSPAFLFEIVVRSDLFSNMVIVLLYIFIFDRYARREERMNAILLGLAGGFLLSTRGIVALIYIVFFLYVIRQNRLNYHLVLLSAAAGFILILLPFLLWNFEYFVRSGPLAIQTSYIPWWVYFPAVAAAVLSGFLAGTLRGVFVGSFITLFGIVLSAFLKSIIEFGLAGSVLGDRFDISYFSFCLPFLLASLITDDREDLSRKSSAPQSP